MRHKLVVILAVLFVSMFGATRAMADEPQPGVARISLIHGDVSTQRGDSGDWVAGTLNAPIVGGDSLSTAARSRAELQLDYANILRLDESAEAKLADLTRTHIQVQISRGLVYYSVFKGSEADVEIDTPNVAVRPLREGGYRIEVTPDGDTMVMVRDGEAEISTPQGSTRLGKNQMITVRGVDNPEYQTADAPRRDSWDNWNRDRDRKIQDAQSWRYANRYYTGVDDLDAYGHWEYVPGYDRVWVPVAAVGWAPYRDGRWVWEPYYGWTWVSYEPWGWAPYHYGRWFVYGGRWCWWPGPVYASYRPIWAPAYVSFFGFGYSGRHFSVGFGFGSIGWLPIGPSDYYYPWWGAHRRSINIVNITNITNITNVHNVRNVRGIDPLGRGRPVRSNIRGIVDDAHMRGSLSSMSAGEFGRSAVPRHQQRVTAAELREGRAVAGNLPIVPTRESLRAVDRAANPTTIPARANRSERFFTRSQPTFRPEPFHQQAEQVREAVQEHQRTFAGREGAGTPTVRGSVGAASRPGLEQEAPNTRVRGAEGQRSAPVTTPRQDSGRTQDGWRRFGSDRPGPAAQSPERPQAQSPERGRSPERAAPQSAPAQGGDRKASPAPSRREPPMPGPPAERRDWQRFTPQPRQESRPAPRNSDQRATPGPAPSRREPPAPGPPAERRDWQRFTPQPRQSQADQQPGADRRFAPERQPGAERQSPWNSRPSANREPAPRREYRPPLDLRRPIVRPRPEARPESNRGGGRAQPPQRTERRGGEGNRGSPRSERRPSGERRPH